VQHRGKLGSLSLDEPNVEIGEEGKLLTEGRKGSQRGKHAKIAPGNL